MRADRRTILSPERMAVTLKRLVLKLAEKHPDPNQVLLVGLQPRGVFLAQRVHRMWQQLHLPQPVTELGLLDVTFHRDDAHLRENRLVPQPTTLPHSVEGQTVVLIDDVLYTGRTVRAALDALLAYGRPTTVELMVLVDRKRKRQMPIEANYVGVYVETHEHERVLVRWAEQGEDEAVTLQHPAG